MNCIDQWTSEDATLYLGDSCEVIHGIPDESIHFGIHSPPFSNLYIYSDSEADMGNCKDDDEFFRHYSYLIAELFRTTITGRLCAVHCKDLPKYANSHGTTGLIDFPGRIIREFESCGWSFHSRVTIWKCPVVERERTNNNGLLHKTIMRDRSQVRQGMADYLLVFRKPPIGTLMSDEPVKDDDGLAYYVGDYSPLEYEGHPSPHARKQKEKTPKSIRIWQRYAEAVWWDVDQMDVLNKGSKGKDERHICPLQLGLIERAVHLWSNKGDVVFSPFAGIGSEGVGAIRQGRRFCGIELKEQYFNQAKANLMNASSAARPNNLPFEECPA